VSVSKKNYYIGSNESDNYSDKIGRDSNVFLSVERRMKKRLEEVVKCDDYSEIKIIFIVWLIEETFQHLR